MRLLPGVPMFETFSRSWDIMKITLSVVKKDKEILIFPILSVIFSIIFFVLMVVPFFMVGLLEAIGLDKLSLVVYFAVIFLLYFGVSFIATFFNVGVVYIAKRRFEGGDASFGEALSFCFSKVHLIVVWSLVSATVGLVLRMIESAGGKKGNAGRIISGIISSIIGMVWSIITIFVVPAMVFNDVGPFKAIKLSIDTIKKTWGESLIRHYGLGFAQAVVIVPIVLFCIALAVVGSAINPLFSIVAILLLVGLMIPVGVFFSALNTVFNTALFWYATTGQVPAEYPPETLQNAFVPRQKPVIPGF
ncbi:MAG: hypothetical protein J7L23_01205 [Candidatus Diapherotrites archaeon]|nr:hypothetical protein [Candidatus Diapherotrites archaeon]